MKQMDDLEEVSDMREEVQKEKDLTVQLSVAPAIIHSFNHSSSVVLVIRYSFSFSYSNFTKLIIILVKVLVNLQNLNEF